MPNVNDLKSSKFLTKNDVEPDALVTITGYKQMNVAMESDSPDEKYTLTFKEFEKPLVLNITNGKTIAAIVGSEDFDDWIGKEVVLYNDKTVMFAGELTGGIRVRARRDNPEPRNLPEPHPDITNPDYVGDDPPKPTGKIPF